MFLWTRTCLIVGGLLCFLAGASDCLDLLEFLIGPRLGTSAKDSRNLQISPAESLVTGFGYPFEAHEVMSDSGYLLSLHRIPSGVKKQEKNSTNKPVALFQHGLFAATDSWLFRGPSKDLPYVLADAGYDVWMSNMRGNYYSRKHKTLNADIDREYWDFSLHEVAYHDLPVIFDYILNQTKQEQIFFLGHSIGSTLGLIFGAIKPEYNSKIKLHLALAPLVYVKHPISLAHKIMFISGVPLGSTALQNNIYNIFPRRTYISKFMQMLCSNGRPLKPLCVSSIFMFTGKDYDQFNASYIPDIVSYFPSGTSVYLLQHTIQLYLAGNFAPYNYGNKSTNFEKYIDAMPKPYNLSKVTHPISLHYGEGDLLVTKEDMEAAENKLPNIFGMFQVPYKKFNHMDFIWGIDAKNLLYLTFLHSSPNMKNYWLLSTMACSINALQEMVYFKKVVY